MPSGEMHSSVTVLVYTRSRYLATVTRAPIRVCSFSTFQWVTSAGDNTLYVVCLGCQAKFTQP